MIFSETVQTLEAMLSIIVSSGIIIAWVNSWHNRKQK